MSKDRTYLGKPIYRRDLQSLRALAVILVIVAHSGFNLGAGGFVGVDIFFVLSGYLITGKLVTEIRASGRLGYADFIWRRIKRLLPALLTMVGAVYILSSIYLSTLESSSCLLYTSPSPRDS